jgi:hypothetical protein
MVPVKNGSGSGSADVDVDGQSQSWDIHLGVGDGVGGNYNYCDVGVFHSWSEMHEFPGNKRHRPFYFGLGQQSNKAYAGFGHSDGSI